MIGGASGQNNSAIINSSTGGNQSVTVSGGAITVTGGAGGLANRAGIVTNANQTISGNPDIVLTGGAGGGAGNNSNNVFIQATGPDTTQQTINARRIEISSGAGTDASATFNAARQVINTTGDVSIFGGAGPGGSNGARIGGIGGTTLGPTNLTLNVGGNLLLHGGTAERRFPWLERGLDASQHHHSQRRGQHHPGVGGRRRAHRQLEPDSGSLRQHHGDSGRKPSSWATARRFAPMGRSR